MTEKLSARLRRKGRWFLKILSRIVFICVHVFVDFAHWLCSSHSLTLTYAIFLRCPSSLTGISYGVWQTRDHWILTSHRRFFFLNSNSLWFLQTLCSGQVMFFGATAASLALVWPGFGHHPTRDVPVSCFTGALPRIYSCSIQYDLLHVQHSSTASSAVLPSAFTHSCCRVHCLCVTLW